MSAQSWNIDPTHSGIHFSVRHMVISKVRGRFGKFTGTLNLDADDLTGSNADIHIDVTSLDTGVTDRDNHLRSPDFFDAQAHPEIVFTSKKVERAGANHFHLKGDLTIKGVTKEVVLEVEHGGHGKDPWGNERSGFIAKTHIDRRDFGLSWNQVLEAGGVLVGERVDVEIEMEAVKPAAAR